MKIEPAKISIELPQAPDRSVYGIRRGRTWLGRLLLEVWRLRPFALRWLYEHEIEYLVRVLDAGEHRERELLRLAEVLRAIERVTAGPHRTPTEAWRALERVRGIVRSTGKPWPGMCPDCGRVAMRRARRCPVCNRTEPDGVKRGPSRHWRRWRWRSRKA